MSKKRILVTTFSLSLVLGTGALAADEWKTVTLNGEPGLTISIPKVVDDYAGGKTPGDLMLISIEAGGEGNLVCFAHRLAYPKGATQSSFGAMLATKRRETFCDPAEKDHKNFMIAGSRSLTHNGMPAAQCVASYEVKEKEMPGRVVSEMVIAAPRMIYFLNCTASDEDQETAQFEWSDFWDRNVSHMQDSFHIPK
ncbi:MAG: hypothetical protein ABL973_15180 [Micropepsaceae bacterium]